MAEVKAKPIVGSPPALTITSLADFVRIPTLQTIPNIWVKEEKEKPIGPEIGPKDEEDEILAKAFLGQSIGKLFIVGKQKIPTYGNLTVVVRHSHMLRDSLQELLQSDQKDPLPLGEEVDINKDEGEAFTYLWLHMNGSKYPEPLYPPHISIHYNVITTRQQTSRNFSISFYACLTDWASYFAIDTNTQFYASIIANAFTLLYYIVQSRQVVPLKVRKMTTAGGRQIVARERKEWTFDMGNELAEGNSVYSRSPSGQKTIAKLIAAQKGMLTKPYFIYYLYVPVKAMDGSVAHINLFMWLPPDVAKTMIVDDLSRQPVEVQDRLAMLFLGRPASSSNPQNLADSILNASVKYTPDIFDEKKRIDNPNLQTAYEDYLRRSQITVKVWPETYAPIPPGSDRLAIERLMLPLRSYLLRKLQNDAINWSDSDSTNANDLFMAEVLAGLRPNIDVYFLNISPMNAFTSLNSGMPNTPVGVSNLTAYTQKFGLTPDQLKRELNKWRTITLTRLPADFGGVVEHPNSGLARDVIRFRTDPYDWDAFLAKSRQSSAFASLASEILQIPQM